MSAGASTLAAKEIVQGLAVRQPEKPINYSKKVSAEESIDLLNSLFKEEEKKALCFTSHYAVASHVVSYLRKSKLQTKS